VNNSHRAADLENRPEIIADVPPVRVIVVALSDVLHLSRDHYAPLRIVTAEKASLQPTWTWRPVQPPYRQHSAWQHRSDGGASDRTGRRRMVREQFQPINVNSGVSRG
jgi:hypothetical protein